MTQQCYKNKNESGIVLVLLTISITAIIAFVGLAIDIGNLYRANLHVQKAADAGSLAAILYRINYVNPSQANIENNAKDIAVANLLLSGVPSPSAGNNVVDVSGNDTAWDSAEQRMYLTAKDTAKLFLLPAVVKGVSQTVITQRTAEAELAPANISLVIDISGSMDCPDSSTDPECTCRLDDSCTGTLKIDQLKTAIAGTGGFLDHFNPNNDGINTRDRINIVPFNMAASLARSVRTTPGGSTVRNGFEAVSGGATGLAEVAAIINGLNPSSATNLADGLLTAFDDYSVVAGEEVFYVVFSDGAPTATTAVLADNSSGTAGTRGNDIEFDYYQIFGIDFIDGAGTATKGTSPFIRRVPPTDASLQAFSLFNYQGTDTIAAPPSGSFAGTRFICGQTDNPVTGCDFVEDANTHSISNNGTGSTGEDDEADSGSDNLVRPNSCTVFDTAFKTFCTRGANFRFLPHKSSSVSTATYLKPRLRDMYQFFYDVPVALSDAIRQNNGTVYVIGLGQQDPALGTTTDVYQNEYNSFYRKDFFLNRIALDNDGDNTSFKRLSNFNFSYDNGSVDSTSNLDRRGEYLATPNAAQLKNLYINIAQKILTRLIK